MSKTIIVSLTIQQITAATTIVDEIHTLQRRIGDVRSFVRNGQEKISVCITDIPGSTSFEIDPEHVDYMLERQIVNLKDRLVELGIEIKF